MTQSEKEALANIQLTQTTDFGSARLKLNGIEIGQWVTSIGIAFTHRDRAPRVYLQLDTPGGLDIDLADADVKVVERTRKALEALGWTPPPKEEDNG